MQQRPVEGEIQLAAKAPDGNVDDVGPVIEVHIPDLLRDFGAREHLAFAAHQQSQQLELLGRELEPLSGADSAPPREVDFQVRAGEIVGVAGVAGNGQSELLQVLSGIEPLQAGHIELGGQVIEAGHEVDARGMRALGLAHVPEDRHKQGLVMSFQAWESAALGYHREDCYAKMGLMDQGQMKADCQAMMHDFDVRPPLPLLGSSKFSGGNQQKLILAREMKHAPKVLLIGQPTRGVDIGAIELIHQRIVAMRDAGVAVLVVSTELDEILGLSDRVLVMNEGHITGELSREEADEPSIGRLMAHSKKGAGHQAAAPETPSEGVAP